MRHYAAPQQRAFSEDDLPRPHLHALARQRGVGRGGVRVRLVEVEAVEVQPEEADLGLALAHVDGAGRGGGARGLGPVGEVLAVGPPALRQEVAAHSEPAGTLASRGATLANNVDNQSKVK